MVKSSFALMRSALYIPGSNPRAIAKASQLQADAVIFDLEDSVAPAAKEEARQTIWQTLAGLERGKTLWAVRINSIGSDYWREDLLSILPAQPDALVIPKVHSASQLESLQPILHNFAPLPALWPMIESPLGVLQAFAIAVHPMVSCLVMGTADLAKEMRVQIRGAKRANLHFALQSVILAARAAQVTVLDGVYGQFKDEEGFLTQCQEGAELGFDGKTLIHPSQVAVANRLFLPAEEEVAFARRVVAAWQQAYERGEEICVVDGRMIERLHAQDALRLISLWEKANAT